MHVARPATQRQCPRERAEDLTLCGWLSTVTQATYITSNFLVEALKAVLLPRSRRTRDLSLHEYLAYHGMRLYQGRLSPLRIQNILPSTGSTCARFAQRHGLSHAVVALEHGAVTHRLGCADAARHVVLLHGGGYMAPALGTHLDFAFGFAAPRADVAVHVLQY
ncbi:hypothetical protein E4U53_008195, partial [Claviceps sorghi]